MDSPSEPSKTDPSGVLTRAGSDAAEVRFERSYATEPDVLWTAVAEPDRLARWLAPIEGRLGEEADFTLRFDDGDVPSCHVLEWDPPRSYTWAWPHATGASHVRLDVLPVGAGSMLRLLHSRLTPSQAPAYAAGWDAYLRRLDDLVAGREIRDSWDADVQAVSARYAAQLA